MARKVIECRTLLPDSQCTMLFAGEAEDVVKAFREHASNSHEYSKLARSVESALQNAVFIGANRAYIGDTFDELESQAIRIPGPGFVIRRFDEAEGADSAAGVTLDCSCTAGTGSCTLLVHGTTARCHNNTCTSCSFVTTVPTVVEPKILKADWLVDPPDQGAED